MAAKRDISRLLGKGLSGTEAGRLVVAHMIELECGAEGFLTEKDINAIRTRLRSGQAADYNLMIDLYRSVREILVEAQVISLQCGAALRDLEGELERYAISAEVHHLVGHLPLLVSQEAYTVMQQRQRERLGARLYCLAEVIEEGAIERLGGRERAEEASENDYEAAYAAAERDIAELVDDGRLTPVRIAHKASLLTVERATQAQLAHGDDDLLAALAEIEAELDEADGATCEETACELAANRAAYEKRLAASLSQGDLTEGHDVSEWCGEVDAEAEERLLHHYLSGDELARAGLPEWQRWLNEFKPWEEGIESDAVAIVTEPGFGDFDNDGRYRSYCLKRLADVAEVRRREELYAKTYGRPFRALLSDVLAKARRCASELLAHEQVITEAGAAARVPFLLTGSDVAAGKPSPFPFVDWRRDLLTDVAAAAESYNDMAARVRRWRGELRGPRLEAFELAALEPDPDTLALLRHRLAVGVGRGGLDADWWREVSAG